MQDLNRIPVDDLRSLVNDRARRVEPVTRTLGIPRERFEHRLRVAVLYYQEFARNEETGDLSGEGFDKSLGGSKNNACLISISRDCVDLCSSIAKG